MDTCAFCRNEIPDDAEVFGVSGKIKPGVDMKEHEGKIVPLVLGEDDRVVPVVIAAADSPAKRECKDYLFMVCSEKCCAELTETVRKELDSWFEIEEM